MKQNARRDACAIAVMAKAPRSGFVKTRLCPPLRPEEAAALGRAFLRDTTENIALAGQSVPVDGFVAFAPAEHESLFEGLIAERTGLLLADGRTGFDPARYEGVSGLGLALLHAMISLFAHGYPAVCLVNADGPTLPTSYLVDAARILLSGSAASAAVMGPSVDGGYYLLGARAGVPVQRLLAAIDWSTERVASQTRDRAAESRIALRELPAWYDVDDADSLVRLMDDTGVPGRTGGYDAPATTALLDTFGLRSRLETTRSL
jgi:glycosyltransferase A (GT-A) superfamily protein (DUF2064 family)